MSKNTIIMLICVSCTLLCGCQKSPRNPASAVRASASAPEASEDPVPPPTDVELRDVITRTFKNVVSVDSSQPVRFLIGDFNGDNSEDIAIVVRPEKEKLSELNSEYANWTLEDLHQVQSRSEQTNTAVPVRVKVNEVLLAVIHGHGRAGWRNALAMQTYLLKNAVAVAFETQSAREINSPGEQRLPQVRGDVIKARLAGSSGIIFWTGGKYAWHSIT